MKLTARLQATLTLSYYSLIPPPPGPLAAAAPDNTRQHTISANQIATVIARMERFIDSDGSLAILFSDVLPLAAPFLLFRLKRTGFSACRTKCVPEGLLLTARR